MSSSQKMILDLEVYTVKGQWYPLEVAVLDVTSLVCRHWLVKWPGMVFQDATTFWQYNHHYLDWSDEGTEWCEVVAELMKIGASAECIYVKGLDKKNYFKKLMGTVNITTLEGPAATDNTTFCCPHHARKTGNCARHKCYNLLRNLDNF